MSKHCPICNRSSDEANFYGEFCEFCTVDKLGEKLPSEVKVTACKRCGRIRLNGLFVEKISGNIGELIKKEYKNFHVKLISDIENAAIIELAKPDESIRGLRKEIAIKYVKVLCPRCNREAASYYEAVLQLRGNPSRIDRMMEKVGKAFVDNDEFISKTQEVPNGIDLYLSSKKLISAFIAEKGLKPVRSYTLYGTKHGKRLYRNTYSLHLD